MIHSAAAKYSNGAVVSMKGSPGVANKSVTVVPTRADQPGDLLDRVAPTRNASEEDSPPFSIYNALGGLPQDPCCGGESSPRIQESCRRWGCKVRDLLSTYGFRADARASE
jgi:hypothetical protein